VKSDDIRGRLKTYEKIVKGQNLARPGVPESFRVLVKELQGLVLDVEIKYSDGTIGELVMDEEDEEGASRRSVVAAPEVKEKAVEKPVEEENVVEEEQKEIENAEEQVIENMLFEGVFEDRNDDPEGAEE
ncbi:MAG TPA: DNA-directed RNA polymerase subunit beta, partial [Aminobacterium sp.]|nr:DNA-directed RNA polymerase subunit beta [Aminobacterium sp.]